jgi:hypothetical protein
MSTLNVIDLGCMDNWVSGNWPVAFRSHNDNCGNLHTMRDGSQYRYNTMNDVAIGNGYVQSTCPCCGIRYTYAQDGDNDVDNG